MVKVRTAVSALLAAVLAVSIAGCSFTNGNQTLPRKYDPSDGVGANVGDLDVRNALIVTDDGSRGSLVVTVINQTDKQKQLSMQYESSSATAANGRETVRVNVPEFSTVTFGYDESEQVVLEDIDTTPGALFPVYFTSGNSEGAELKVPVLDTTLAEYDGLTPSPSPTAVPTPSATPTAVPVPIPTPTEGTAPEGDNSGDTAPGDSVDSGQ
ncbi:hypothetical protein [Naasia aerilata]|uniref:DNA modification methylase n=1 Tax=Naasia aerilata TaxID=1162966 RepID=A0ABN6XJ19_9MICO|nr:hypothetical protein [Naasia aerilata]BDZ44849.1 hypothetical protein GCM10025866_07580 [Naasia aerilata]